jgi:hypothetical protein
LRVAEKKGLPVKRVLQLALMEYFKEERKKP